MADVIFVMHRAITVNPVPKTAPETTPRPTNPYRDYAVKDSRSNFVVSEVDEAEAQEAERKRHADVAARVEELRREKS